MSQLYAILVDIEGEYGDEAQFSGMVHFGEEASAQAVVDRLNTNQELLKSHMREVAQLRSQKQQALSRLISEYEENNPQEVIKIPKGPASIKTDEDRALVLKIEQLKEQKQIQAQRQHALFESHRNAINQECEAHFNQLIEGISFVDKRVELSWGGRQYLTINGYSYRPTVTV